MGVLFFCVLAVLSQATAMVVIDRRVQSVLRQTGAPILEARIASAAQQGPLVAGHQRASAVAAEVERRVEVSLPRVLGSTFLNSMATHRPEMAKRLRGVAAAWERRTGFAAERADHEAGPKAPDRGSLEAALAELSGVFERLAEEQTLCFRDIPCFLVAAAIPVALVYRAMRRNESRQETARKQAHQLARHLIEDYERWSHLIALDLHDNIAQRLCAMLPMLGPRDASAARAVCETMDRVTTRSRGLRPIPGLTASLSTSIRRLCSEVAAASGLPARFSPAGSEHLEVPPQVAIQIYRMAEQALANAVKHAEAQSIRVTLAVSYPRLIVRVANDGSGIWSSGAAEGLHVGLRGMRERAQLLDGELTVSSRAGGRTAVKTAIPITELRNEKTQLGAHR